MSTMSAIKVVLVAFVLLLLLWTFRNRKRVGMRAGARIGAIAVAAFAIVSVIDPDITSRAARAVGVGRGTDLVLYLLVVVFAFTSSGLYFRSRDLERKLDDVVRLMAIREAMREEGSPERDQPSLDIDSPSAIASLR
jgi:small membrane protein